MLRGCTAEHTQTQVVSSALASFFSKIVTDTHPAAQIPYIDVLLSIVESTPQMMESSSRDIGRVGRIVCGVYKLGSTAGYDASL